MRGYESHDRGIIITLLSKLALSFFPADYLDFVNSVTKLFACVITLDNSCYLVISNLSVEESSLEADAYRFVGNQSISGWPRTPLQFHPPGIMKIRVLSRMTL